MNEKFEKYIKDLSPELQEKAREIKTEEELNAFLAENELELPEEALELVSGGGGCGGHECNVDSVIERYIFASPFPIIKGIECAMVTMRACSECGNAKFFCCESFTFGQGAQAELSEAEYNSVKAANKEYIPHFGGVSSLG